MNKNRIFYFLIGLSVGFSMYSKQLTPQEAWNRILSSAPGTRALTSLSPSFTYKSPSNTNFNTLYIFETSPGYLIVSADDIGFPLLGYSEKENFNPVELSPGLKYWLDFYSEELDYAATRARDTTTEIPPDPNRPPVAPLLTCKWDQDHPFNSACPVYWGKTSYTGCVATAMAQVMYYHQWPEECGGGVLNYTSDMGSIYKSDLSIDFDTIKFNWSAMTDTYSEDSTQESQEAVALLMKACGYAVQMKYTPLVSAAYSFYIGEAFNKYFGYSDYVQMPERDYYSLEQWEEMIYDQLAQGLPVPYGGATSKDEGHQFVCDGYSAAGYFHMNWGWSGVSDAYFRLSALNPGQQGIGGASSGFNYDQEITINVCRPGEEPKNAKEYLIYCMDNFTTKGLGANPKSEVSELIYLGKDLVFFPRTYQGIINNGCHDIEGNFGILIEKDSGEKIESYCIENLMMESFSNFSNITVTIPENLEEGNYTLSPIFRISGKEEYIFLACPLTKIKNLNMKVSQTKAIITPGETAMEYSGLSKQSSDYSFTETTYFNLQGTKVAQPRKGEFLIMKTGTTTKKIVY